MNRTRIAWPLAALCLLAAGTGGCNQSEESFTLQGFVRSLLGPAPDKQVDMLMDEKDADNRREGVVMLSNRDWGLQEPFLEGYSKLAEYDADASVRSAAIRALGKAGDPKYRKVITRALYDESATVRWDAATALDRLPGDDAVTALRERAARDPSADVRASSAKALRHYRNPEVFETLVRCMTDQAYGVRYRARQALTEMTGEDLGPDAEAWEKRLGTKLPEPKPESGKPWWDWFGVTGGSTEPSPSPQGNGLKGPKPVPAPRGPTRESPRPWWDWLGVTKRQAEPAPAGAVSAGGAVMPKAPDAKITPPALRGAEAPAKPSRPWWDWAGVTRQEVKKEALPRGPAEHRIVPPSAAGIRPPTKPRLGMAPAPAEEEARPWWDWLGVTKRKPADAPPPEAAPAPEKAKTGRPWWDWLGVTDRKKGE